MKLGVAKAFDRKKKKTDKVFVIILIATLLMAGVVYTLVTCGNTWLGTRLAFTHLMVLMWLALFMAELKKGDLAMAMATRLGGKRCLSCFALHNTPL